MWLFSKAMIDRENLRYSRERVAESSVGTCSDGGVSARSKKTPTPLAYCSHGKMTVPSNLSRSGMTFAHLTDDLGEELLTSYRAGFPARISALPVRAQESPVSGVVSGRNSRASLARFDRQSRSWKTHQLSLLEDSGLCSATFSRSGMMLDGELYPLKMPVLHTEESDSGSLPTPTAQSYGSNQGGSAGRVGPVRLSLQSMASRQVWPMPRNNTGPSTDSRHLSLDGAVRLWPTPTVHGNYNRKGVSPRSGDGLATAVGGKLNPQFVEWLMGWPIGWTSLDALEMDKFQQWRDSHLKF